MRLSPPKAPLVVVRVWPSVVVPETVGAAVLVGAMLEVTVVGVTEVAVAVPTHVPVELVAVTITWA